MACVTDVFSRMVLGWSSAGRWRVAVSPNWSSTRSPWPSSVAVGTCLASSITASELAEYTSHALVRELRRDGGNASMGSVADCYDNALAE